MASSLTVEIPQSSSTKNATSTLTAFSYVISDPAVGQSIAAGNLFAASHRQVASSAKAVMQSALRVLDYSWQTQSEPTRDVVVKCEQRALPLPAPPAIAFRREDWLMSAAELILSEPAIRTQLPKLARRALHCDAVDSYVAAILETDPNVRLKRASMASVRWDVAAGHRPCPHPYVRVAIHLTGDHEPIPLCLTTITATLCILLRSINYRRKTGLTAHRNGSFAVPSSATARAALARDQLGADSSRLVSIDPVARYLRQIGLDGLSLSLRTQANTAISKREVPRSPERTR